MKEDRERKVGGRECKIEQVSERRMEEERKIGGKNERECVKEKHIER